MLEDRRLIRDFKRGHEYAPCRIYEKYKDYLLTLATTLLNDVSTAEDILHSVFVGFTEGISKFELNGSLRSYLAICVANRARNINKAKQQQDVGLDGVVGMASEGSGPEQLVMHDEELQQLAERMQLLPYEQKEVITLHLKGGLTFKTVADMQGVSINTAQSRYRYGLKKLRSLFNEEAGR